MQTEINYSVSSKPDHSGMVGSATTAAEATEKAREYAALLLANDPKRTHCEIEIYELCEKCKGNGTLKGPRKFQTRPCKRCDASGIAVTLHTETFARPCTHTL